MFDVMQGQLPVGIPVPSTKWEFWAVFVYLTIQSLIQLYQLRQANEIKAKAEEIKKQTNGLVSQSVQLATEKGRAEGQLSAVLSDIKSHDGE
ncbi:MAG TPA: hypothetical protein VHU91_06785 [Mycobacteriales bacterium]|jgi:hypothetical protein|nr:hypothetical protein [Mycobacteriales bacterium]